jgi:hypothetical protein
MSKDGRLRPVHRHDHSGPLRQSNAVHGSSAFVRVAWIAAGLIGRIVSTRQTQFGILAVPTSDELWVMWALHVDAPALIVPQIGLATMNILGALKTGTVAKT